MTTQIVLLAREWTAQQLILLAMRVAPKPYALAIGKAILNIKYEV